jgi:hypothetical protein
LPKEPSIQAANDRIQGRGLAGWVKSGMAHIQPAETSTPMPAMAEMGATGRVPAAAARRLNRAPIAATLPGPTPTFDLGDCSFFAVLPNVAGIAKLRGTSGRDLRGRVRPEEGCCAINPAKDASASEPDHLYGAVEVGGTIRSLGKSRF